MVIVAELVLIPMFAASHARSASALDVGGINKKEGIFRIVMGDDLEGIAAFDHDSLEALSEARQCVRECRPL